MSKKAKQSPIRQRNWVQAHPLMRKGGAHGKPRKAERRQTRMALSRGHVPDLKAA